MVLDRPPIAAEMRPTLAVAEPLAAANLAQMAMQVTNAVMVGHLGAVPLAAAGLGNALNATLLMTSQGLLTAVAPLAAHSIGAGDHPAAGRVAGGGLIVATAVAAPMMATLLVVPPLLSGLGYEPDLVAEIGRFLWAISWGIPGFLGAAVLRFLLIAAFRTRIVMIVPLLAVPLNLVLNWVLIFGHWGMPALGSAVSGVRHGNRAMADALQLRPLHADRQGKDIGQHGSRRAAPDPRHPAAWLADRGHARARDRGVRDDRRHDGDDRRRCAGGASAGLQRRWRVFHGASRPRPGGDRRGRLSARPQRAVGGAPRRVCGTGDGRFVHDGRGAAAMDNAAHPHRLLPRSRRCRQPEHGGDCAAAFRNRRTVPAVRRGAGDCGRGVARLPRHRRPNA